MANQSIMHLAFYTNQLPALRDFYENTLGAKPRTIVRFSAYKGVKNRGDWAKLAETNPNGIVYVFEELAPGQFLELFPVDQPLPKAPTLGDGTSHYSHFSILVDDIQASYQHLLAHGAPIDTKPNIGNSHTWQMWTHDPDGNMIELMQYTDQSFQLTGHIDERI
ncbi:VOC family protein [Lacticaseibacillus salsurivasis]|uniref:VOC family protein n=1 Tax=Lacticaseibacillus salsurivasis TaxID=3081441 RepID=UPI0030C6C3DE